jgi:iron complex transport system substrate-binding protein
MHDLLEIAGATNVFADVKRESVLPSQEQLIVRKPDVIVEVNGQTGADEAEAIRAWSVLGSIPAVRGRRIRSLGGAYLVVPGPRLGEAAEALAQAIHPAAF